VRCGLVWLVRCAWLVLPHAAEPMSLRTPARWSHRRDRHGARSHSRALQWCPQSAQPRMELRAKRAWVVLLCQRGEQRGGMWLHSHTGQGPGGESERPERHPLGCVARLPEVRVRRLEVPPAWVDVRQAAEGCGPLQAVRSGACLVAAIGLSATPREGVRGSMALGSGSGPNAHHPRGHAPGAVLMGRREVECVEVRDEGPR
jgi:hypothetical protein